MANKNQIDELKTILLQRKESLSQNIHNSIDSIDQLKIKISMMTWIMQIL